MKLKLHKVFKLKENTIRAVIIAFIVSFLPFLVERNAKAFLSTFILILLGAWIGNLVYDILNFYIKLKKWKKENKS